MVRTNRHKNLSAHLDKLDEEDPLRLTEIIWHLFKCDDKRRVAEIYGSRWLEWVTSKYSRTIRDILIERNTNLNWVCSMLSEQGLTNDLVQAITNNVNFNLDEIIKDDLSLNPRLRLFKTIQRVSEELHERNPK